MSLEFYKILHIIGIALIIVPLGGLTLHSLNGGNRATNKHVKMVAITHGIGMMVTIVSGFGMLARLNLMSSLPGWTFVKVGIWLIFGLANTAAVRFQKSAMLLWFNLFVLVGIAASLAILKPF